MTPSQEGSCRFAHRSIVGGARLAVLVFLGLLCTMPCATAQDTTPYVPKNSQVVLQNVPPTTDPRVRRFDKLREEFNKHPHDVAKATALAKAYIDYGRSTGDARYLGRAMAVITPFMHQPRPPVGVLLMHATIQQSRHAFSAARVELDHILQLDPNNVQAWLTLATVAMVQGDHDLANKSCVHVGNAAGDFMGLVCTASLRSLSGHADQAYRLLALVQDPGPKAPPEIQAWLQGLIADTAARMGKTDEADAHFRKALEWTPGDNFLLADYGSFLIDQGRYKDAIKLIGSDLQSDTSFLVVVRAEAAMGAPRAEADTTDMKARFASMAERGDHVFMREESAFQLHVLHDPQAALKLAREDWAKQRAPKDVRVYLEAALAAHDPAAARPVLDFVRTTGLHDVTIDPLVAQLHQQLDRQPNTTNMAEVGTGATKE